MGAKIRGAGTDVIRVQGVDSLKAQNIHTIIPDRIEAGTYLSVVVPSAIKAKPNNDTPALISPASTVVPIKFLA